MGETVLALNEEDMESVIQERESKFISIRRNDMLKLIAMITMFIDHLGHMGIVGMIVEKLNMSGHMVTYDYYTLVRSIGRIAFPIFAYQVALGYAKTSNLRRYISRLIVFALVSHIPYIVFDRNFVVHPFHFNVIFMLLFGVFAIMCLDQAKAWMKERGMVKKVLAVAILILMMGIIVFPQLMDAYVSTQEIINPSEPLITLGNTAFMVEKDFAFSYGTYGILMVLMFYVFKGRPIGMTLSFIALSFVGVWLSYGNYVYIFSGRWIGESFGFLESYIYDDRFKFLLDYEGGLSKLDGLFFQMRSLMALPFIIGLERFYIRIKLNKFVGYWFYPLHMALLFVVALLMKQIMF